MCDDYIDFTDDPCPKCGNLMVTKECNRCGGEGMTEPGELYDEDPLWYYPNDVERCDECRGRGYWEWCQKCGWDETEKRFINGNKEESIPKESNA